ncbi:hypothetical protein AX15_000996 [Amanita polypyramis BW_CC]|nr:hypothetical protein AX15_000996 [Amanita polypyramis BW_CC]
MTPVIRGCHPRLQESFDIIRQEMEATTVELEKLRTQRDDYESKVNAQLHELSLMRRSLYELESQRVKFRQQYEEEVSRLRSEISRFQTPGNGSTHSITPNGIASTDPRNNGRDRTRPERERGATAQPHGRVIDPERELDRLTDHRSAKRLKSRADQTAEEESPTRRGSPLKQFATDAVGTPGLRTSVSPKSAIPSSADCPTGTRPHQFCDSKSNFSWSVVHNPKVPKVLDVKLLHTFTHGRYVTRLETFPPLQENVLNQGILLLFNLFQC